MSIYHVIPPDSITQMSQPPHSLCVFASKTQRCQMVTLGKSWHLSFNMLHLHVKGRHMPEGIHFPILVWEILVQLSLFWCPSFFGTVKSITVIYIRVKKTSNHKILKWAFCLLKSQATFFSIRCPGWQQKKQQSFASLSLCEENQPCNGCHGQVHGKYLLTLNVRGPSLTRSISWLLMSCLPASPGHKQSWCWLCRMGRSLSYLGKDFNHLCHINVEERQKM